MKLNVAVPHQLEIPAMTQAWEYELGHDDVRIAMQLADDLGFHKAILGEHFIMPTDHLDNSGGFWHHGTVMLAGIAGQTRRLKVASSISILPLQHPAVQAKAWATLDWLSGGRAVPAFGVGWLREEFELLGVSFEERGRISDEYITAIILLWTEDHPSFEGRYVSFREAGFAPKPFQKPYPPIWFGGDAKGPLGRVAKWGTGWEPFLTPPERFPDSLDYIRSHRDYSGRPIEIFFPIEFMKIGEGHLPRASERTVGSWNAQETVDLCGWLSRLGVTETIIPLPPLDDFDAYLDRLRWVAEEVMPLVVEL